MKQRTCKSCGETKPVSEFYKVSIPSKGWTGYKPFCKTCNTIIKRAYAKAHREQVNKYQRELYGKFREERQKRSREFYRTNKEYIRQNVKQQRAILRSAALDILGRKCAKCGYDADVRALQIDHIDGGGKRERKSIHSSGVLRKIIATNGKGYQTLCANCNCIKRFENGE